MGTNRWLTLYGFWSGVFLRQDRGKRATEKQRHDREDEEGCHSVRA